MLEDIITHTKQTSKICFKNIEFCKKNYFDKSKRSLSQKIKNRVISVNGILNTSMQMVECLVYLMVLKY